MTTGSLPVHHRFTTGLSAGRKALFVPGCWPVYRCLFVYVNLFSCTPFAAPTQPARGVSGFWIRQVISVSGSLAHWLFSVLPLSSALVALAPLVSCLVPCFLHLLPSCLVPWPSRSLASVALWSSSPLALLPSCPFPSRPVATSPSGFLLSCHVVFLLCLAVLRCVRRWHLVLLSRRLLRATYFTSKMTCFFLKRFGTLRVSARKGRHIRKVMTSRIQNPDIPQAGRVGAPGGAAGRGRAGRRMAGSEETSTVRFAQETSVPRAHLGNEDNCPERPFGSTNSLIRI